MSNFYPFKPQALSRIVAGVDLPASDQVVTASSADARVNSATQMGVIFSLVSGIGGFILGQHLVVHKKAKG